MPEVVEERHAREDLVDLWQFIAVDSVAAADRVIESIREAYAMLELFPNAGRARPELRDDLRSLADGSYVILYRLTPARVEIIRIVHGARDISPELFAEDD